MSDEVKQCDKCGHHCHKDDGYCVKCGSQVEHIKCEPWTEFRFEIVLKSRCKNYKCASDQMNRVVAHCEYEAMSVVGTVCLPVTNGHRLTWREDREDKA